MAEEKGDKGDPEVIETQEPEVSLEEQAKQAFVEAVPQFAELYDDLDPPARAGILTAHLAESSLVTEPDGTRTTNSSPGEKPSPEPAQDTNIPSADVDLAEQEEYDFCLELGTDEKLAKKRAKLAGDRIRRETGLSQLVVNALEDMNEAAVVPQQWYSAMQMVTGATESDLKVAKEILKTSPSTDKKLVLELAVARRTSKAISEQGAPVLSEKALRITAAIKANNLANNGPRGGAPVIELEDSDDLMRTLRLKEEAVKGK